MGNERIMTGIAQDSVCRDDPKLMTQHPACQGHMGPETLWRKWAAVGQALRKAVCPVATQISKDSTLCSTKNFSLWFSKTDHGWGANALHHESETTDGLSSRSFQKGKKTEPSSDYTTWEWKLRGCPSWLAVETSGCWGLCMCMGVIEVLWSDIAGVGVPLVICGKAGQQVT